MEDLSLKELFDHLQRELRQMNKELKDISSSTHENTISLKEHMRRTEALEKYVEILHTKVDTTEKDRAINQAISQYKQQRLDFSVKILAGLAAISTIVFGYLKLRGIM